MFKPSPPGFITVSSISICDKVTSMDRPNVGIHTMGDKMPAIINSIVHITYKKPTTK